MTTFWNKTTISILILALFFPAIIIIINLIYSVEGLGIANAITLFAVFITILSTLYSNYQSDLRLEKQLRNSESQFNKQIKENKINLKEQLIFDKKQEISLELYKDLNKYWEYMDYEKINFLIESEDFDPYINPLTSKTFIEIYQLACYYKYSPKFYYLTDEIQKIINNFIKNCTSYNINTLYATEYFDKKFYDSLEILSKIYPILRKELGIKY